MKQRFTISFTDGKDFKTYNSMLTLMKYWCKDEKKTENKPIVKISKNRRKNKK